MSVSKQNRGLTTLATAAFATFLTFSPIQANDAPQVTVAGAEAGVMQLGNPVQLRGIAQDADGIKQIYGTIQSKKDNKFITKDGKFSENPSRLQFQFNNSAATRWMSQSMNLLRGEYVFRIRVEDATGNISPIMEIPFIATGAKAVAQPKPVVRQATTTTQATTQAATQTAAVAAPTGKASNGMSYCSSKGMDADGDGFGWESNTSCVVAGSKADKHPTCASSASDPDGDGYGWENEKSCIVVVHCASANSDPDGDGFGWENERSCIVLAKDNTSGFPTCRAGAASDPDGDGYGWEKNATCLVK